MEHLPSDQRYTSDQLAALANVPLRTLRYYIQLGLVDRPIGETRAAYYTWQHLRQLLEVRSFTEQGLSLERIASIRKRGDEPAAALPAPRSTGEVTVRSHIQLGAGVELVVDPTLSKMTPEQLRRFAHDAIAAFDRARAENEHKE